MNVDSFVGIGQWSQRFNSQCIRACNSAWNTPLREAFLRIFPLLLLMNTVQALSLWLVDYEQIHDQLLGVAGYIANSISFVFLLYALQAVSVSYTLDRFSLFAAGILGYMVLLVRTGEVVVLSFGASLFVVASSALLALQLHSHILNRASESSITAVIVQRSLAAIAVVLFVFLFQIPIFYIFETLFIYLQNSLADAALQHQSSGLGVNALYLLAVFLRSVLGFMGFHGHNALYEFFEVLYEARQYFRAVDVVFTSPGGNGATLCFLVAALYLWSKGRRLNSYESQAIPFGLININELLLYGYPLIWNPVFLAPFILVPLMGAGMGLLCVSMGLLDQTAALQSWMTPSLMQLSFISSSWPTLLMVFCLYLALGAAFYARSLSLFGRISMQSQLNSSVVEKATMLGANSGDSLQLSLDTVAAQRTVARWMRSDTICFFYQPIVSASGQVVAVEALLRLRDGEQTKGPFELLQACELLGLEAELDRYVMSQAPTEVAKLASDYPELQVAVNISPAFTRESDFLDRVKSALDSSPLTLVLELTEGAPVEDMAMLCDTFAEVQAEGRMLIAIDDYGSGYASLSYLQSIRGDKLKLDQSLMAGLDSERGREVIRATVELAHRLGFSVVAEGVETKTQLEYLLEMQVDTFQGFYFSRPIPYHELKVFLQNIAEHSWNDSLHQRHCA